MVESLVDNLRRYWPVWKIRNRPRTGVAGVQIGFDGSTISATTAQHAVCDGIVALLAGYRGGPLYSVVT